MLIGNDKIFRNCLVFIYCHLTKVSSQINKCIIFEPNELSVTLYNTIYSMMNLTEGGYFVKNPEKGDDVATTLNHIST